MTELVFIVVALLILVAFAGLVTAKTKSNSATSDSLPYQSVNALLSAAERSFLGVLDRAVGSDYRVFGKVRVADIAAVKSGLSNSARQVALNRVAAKHFDFAVCRASDLSLVCAVELNDKSHLSQRARSRPVRGAGMPHCWPSTSYSSGAACLFSSRSSVEVRVARIAASIKG